MTNHVNIPNIWLPHILSATLLAMKKKSVSCYISVTIYASINMERILSFPDDICHYWGIALLKS